MANLTAEYLVNTILVIIRLEIQPFAVLQQAIQPPNTGLAKCERHATQRTNNEVTGDFQTFCTHQNSVVTVDT